MLTNFIDECELIFFLLIFQFQSERSKLSRKYYINIKLFNISLTYIIIDIIYF